MPKGIEFSLFLSFLFSPFVSRYYEYRTTFITREPTSPHYLCRDDTRKSYDMKIELGKITNL